MEETPEKIKFICRMTGGTYSEEVHTDEQTHSAPVTADEQSAQQLLHAFAPDALLREMAQTGGGDAVLVFRTDSVQMQEFRTLLETGEPPVKEK